MWEELLGFAFCEHEAVCAAGHREPLFMPIFASVHENGRDGAFAIGNQADALHSDLRAIIKEGRDDFLVDRTPVVFLEHGVAVVAAVIATARERHVDRDWCNAFAIHPVADTLGVPSDFGSIEDQTVNMVFKKGAHDFMEGLRF